MEKKEYDDRFIEEVEKITSKLRELNFSDEHVVRVSVSTEIKTSLPIKSFNILSTPFFDVC